jgi:hypothetical protein
MIADAKALTLAGEKEEGRIRGVIGGQGWWGKPPSSALEMDPAKNN